MAVTIGTQLGSYTVTSLLGKGGMGEVYRARDTKLKREVAIKVLPDAFSRDADRVARFQREAEVLASLNHPNIAAIYNVEEAGGTRFLVLELVEGATLAERLARGPFAVLEALNIAKSICEALEAAHEQGVAHRDLKLANVKITPDGKVKVLDFGLAKAFAGEAPDVNLSNSPTLSMAATNAGVILGTPAYMSPEQARGENSDRRADIFSFGCVLYELLTGRQAFQGKTISDILASVLARDPDFNLLPAKLNPRIQQLLRRTLEKEPKRRWQAAGDLRMEIEAALADPRGILVEEQRGAAARPLWKRSASALLWALIGGVIAGVGVWALRPGAPPGASALARLTLALPPGDQLSAAGDTNMAFSADGAQFAYVGLLGRQLYVRKLDSLETKVIPGTEGAASPFFSPDGQWIGFFARGKLRKVSIAGGSSQILCDAPNGEGGTWGPDDAIYFAPIQLSGIWKVSASGGKAEEVTKLDRSKGEVSHRWPQVLLGGKALLFTVWTGPGWDESHIHLQILGTGERRVLVQGANSGRYVPAGYVIYSRAGVLMSVPFDLARLNVTGGARVALAEQVVEGSEGAQYAVSDSGAFAYAPGNLRRYERRLVWVDRKGTVEPVSGPLRTYDSPAISPDGRRAAVEIDGGTIGIWMYDLSRGTVTPLTSAGSSQRAVWSPDGKRIAYRGTRTGFRNVYWKPADGTGNEERLTTSENTQTPGYWSSDGRLLAFSENSPETGSDIWVWHLDGERKAEPFLKTPFNETSPRFSPDGHWLAYVSNESGRNEVYVQPYPGPGEKTQISTEGGNQPTWSRNGRELFYRNGDKMMVVDVRAQPTFTAGSPRLLFEGRYESTAAGGAGYDVSPDGLRFLMVQASEPDQAATQINVVLNWFQELK